VAADKKAAAEPRGTPSGMVYPQDLTERRTRWLLAICWLAVVCVFATQWFAYDAARGSADRLPHYLWWSFYTWGVLTPSVAALAYHVPITRATWTRALPLHLGASLVLVASEIFIEALVGKLQLHHALSIQEALRHYFARHTQVSLLTYWMLVGVVQLYRLRDEARKRELQAYKLEAQLRAAQLGVLRAQIQPHFLFNTLQAATTLIHDDPDGAEDILLRLSELLRMSVDESDVHEIALERELEALDLYLGIQTRRFGDRLRVEMSIDGTVRNCLVPALILQPLVENAIRHGIGTRKGNDTISIRGFEERGYLRLEVRNVNSRLDDEQARLLDRGVGLANTRARLGQLYGSRQDFSLRNVDPVGVCAAVSIPIRSVLAFSESSSR
jgi:two-component system, LytTR family, sensor kinase